ncbi:hypothetical protein D6833_09715 [Candidatus Parcubacteria bacterium]|nr:MAG: hypothetical protein D6833_09715 [Candidatus Parcubacteria bacterium]
MNTTYVLEVTYCLTAEARRRICRETGEMPVDEQRVYFDLREATPEQREQILRVAKVDRDGTVFIQWGRYENAPRFDSEPTLEQLVEVCRQYADEQDKEERAHLAQAIEEKIEMIRRAIQKHDPSLHSHLLLHGSRLKRARELGIDTTPYNNALKEYKQLQPQFREEENQRLEELRKEQERAEMAKVEERKRREAEKLAWIKQHGSELLRRAVAAGHDCDRRYLLERAAMEYPGFVLDYNETADWRERSCPTINALNERDEVLKAHPDVRCSIVWLTSEPSNAFDHYDEPAAPGDPDMPYCVYDENAPEREAIIVVDPTYNGKYLVK